MGQEQPIWEEAKGINWVKRFDKSLLCSSVYKLKVTAQSCYKPMNKNNCGKVGFKSFPLTKFNIKFLIFVNIWEEWIAIYLFSIELMSLSEEGGM